MSDFGKVTVRGLFSRNSTYDNPEQDTKTLLMALTPDECIHRVVDVPAGAGLDIVAIDEFDATLTLVLKNNGATYACQVTWDDEVEGSSCIMNVPTGGVAVIPGIDPGSVVNLLMTSPGEEEVEFILFGS